MGRFITFLSMLFIAVIVWRWLRDKFMKSDYNRPPSDYTPSRRSPWQEGDVEDADFEDL